MAIQPGNNFCSNLKKYVGNVTLPEHTGVATHVLVFMLTKKKHWKQVIGYHLTGDSIKSGCLKNIIFDLIRKAEEIGFRVHAAISDCGGNNKRLWNDVGIQHTQATVMSNKPIQHPCDENRKLEIMPDVVHVCKSMIQGWIANRTIQLPNDVVKRNDLSTPIAVINHLTDIVSFEGHCDLKMASGLTKDDVNSTKALTNFEKMKVRNSQSPHSCSGTAAICEGKWKNRCADDCLPD
ncbi:uncharacterized protein LOC134221111 [Armigeres subalbatus]|uniref:uncharacterized protein LOC134221111 n=1 Tax=Armigeres subalbatus TaxID=124917 RepID=UPI002ED29D94